MEINGAPECREILDWTGAVITGFVVDRIQIRWHTLTKEEWTHRSVWTVLILVDYCFLSVTFGFFHFFSEVKF